MEGIIYKITNKVNNKVYFHKNTPEHNLELAKKWLEEFKNKTVINNPYNKENKLPKKHAKCFNISGDSLENTLIKAIEYRDNILKTVTIVEQPGKPGQDNPHPSP